MTPGLTCTIRKEERNAPLLAIGAACLYCALAGSLCDMASLSTHGLAPLAPGLALVLVCSLLPRTRRWTLALFLAAALALAAALLLTPWLDGGKALLNRLFLASEARQAYTYEKFTATGDPAAPLLPAGVLLGTLLGASARWRLRWMMPLPTVALCASAAYLGVSPQPWYLAAACAALTLCFLRTGPVRAIPALLALAAICAAILLAVPGEDVRLSAWEEQARDALALHTVSFGQTPQPEDASPPVQALTAAQHFREEETAADTGGDETPLHRPPATLWAVLAFALVLFIPAVLSDRLKKRRARNRAALADEDAARAVRAGFLYAMRWLRLGGLPDGNRPFSAYADSVPPALRAAYETALPLWQEAAYSGHTMTPAQRAQMGAFAEKTREAVWHGLDRKSRFVAKYILAL